MERIIHAVLFDLDGTLADTAPDLGGALNALLRKKGLPEKEPERLRPYAGHGAAALLDFAVGIDSAHPDFPQWRQEYLTEYERCFHRDTVLFDGVKELLNHLYQQNITWGIITNKPKKFTEPLIPHLQFPMPPAVVVSGDTCSEAKPSVLPMQYACRQIDIPPEHCLYIGDAERDIQAGRNAGMKTALASWGYLSDEDNTEQWGADFILNVPQDVIGCLF